MKQERHAKMLIDVQVKDRAKVLLTRPLVIICYSGT